MAAPASKASSYRTGRLAEIICMMILMLKGYRLLAWRWRSRRGEIDIIVIKNKVIAFVEVKARPSLASGMEAVSTMAQQRIRNAASDYIQRSPNRATLVFRFDLMIVRPRSWPHHIVNAW